MNAKRDDTAELHHMFIPFAYFLGLPGFILPRLFRQYPQHTRNRRCHPIHGPVMPWQEAERSTGRIPEKPRLTVAVRITAEYSVYRTLFFPVYKTGIK